MTIELCFLGVGDATQRDLGHASVCIDIADQRLLVDCGPGTLDRFWDTYQSLPDAVFITHCHLDHIADLEKLFIKNWFSESSLRPLFFVPAPIIELLHQRVANYPSVVAEGGVNFWEAFQLIPVTDKFEFAEHTFFVRPARHHAPNTAFSLALPGYFYFTGDTRPIPEILNAVLGENDLIFHDCSVVGNPSHTGIDDLQREYSDALRARIHCYHYNRSEQGQHFADAGLKYLVPGQRFVF